MCFYRVNDSSQYKEQIQDYSAEEEYAKLCAEYILIIQIQLFSYNLKQHFDVAHTSFSHPCLTYS